MQMLYFLIKYFLLNDKGNKAKKIKDFKNYRINSNLMKVTRNPQFFFIVYQEETKFLNDVFLGKQSKVWQQALNRVHVQKSILLYCFGKLR